MNAERWQQIEQIYHAALERSAEDRASYLAEACSGDDSLRREVESLLAYEDEAQNFIESPALEIAAKSLGEQHQAGEIGQTINQYKIITPIGVGGMGEVYLAEDTRLKRRVALKFLPAHFLKDKRYLNRFEREAHAVAALSHPNVCMIHEVVQTPAGRHCIVMEYVEGETLRQRMQDHPFTVSEALDVTIQIASALSAAHTAGIVHRDIKLENIMLRRDGYVKILDFGLAKLTDRQNSIADMDAATRLLNTTPGLVMGTVSYMSPEQARGLVVDARSDIWSLGVVLYELVSGQQPFKGETPTDVIIAIAEREPALLSVYAPGVPDQLERIVKKALAKNRDERYQTARDMLIDLKSLKRELEIETEVGRFKEGKPSDERMLAPGSGEVANSGPRFLGMRRARAAIVISLIGVIIVAALLVYAVYFRGAAKPIAQNAIQSLAVLPITNVSGDPLQDYFADGLTDTLIAGLDNVAALRVISRSSVGQYKGVRKPLRDIAHELNVDAILEGSVKRTGDRVLLSVRLVHSPDEQEVWNATYDRDVRDIPMLQNEVARAVTEAIQIKVTPREQVRLTQKRSIDPIAYDYFLRGRFYLNRQTKADNQTAIELFERAVATDPNFAAGFAELAQACVWRLFLFTPKEKQWEEKAFVAIEKALDLDPDLAEAHLARGRLLWTPANHFPHDKAIQEYQLALDLNPNLDEARNQLALVYGHIGLLDEALRELERALAINPSNTLARFRTSEILMFQGKYEEALAAMRSVPPESNPALVGHEIAWTLFNLGRKDDAASVIQQFLKEDPEDNGGLFTGLQAVLAAAAGQEPQAEEKIKAAIEKGKGFGHFHHTDYYIACAYALMKKPAEAINFLQAAADDGFPCYPLFEHDANLNNLRSDARFLSFLERQKQRWDSFKQLDSAR